MISTISDFLEEFKKNALSKIDQEEKDITHTPTIGNIFEGLTANILNKAIFKGLNLKIVNNSFIYNNDKELSDEIDCMLVIGEGINISFTNSFKYHINDVIAVFQVKKNLFRKDIEEAHNNLFSVIKLTEERQLKVYEKTIFRDAYKCLHAKDIPTPEIKKRFTERQNTIFDYLISETVNPIRIVIGFNGYKSEYGLRKGFVEILENLTQKGKVKGYFPESFPNLYICGNSTIIKNNGMPMGMPLTNDEYYFPVLFSSNGKPMLHLLEMIWTRLSYKFSISSKIFGYNFDSELIHSFLYGKEQKISEDCLGWDYWYHPLSKLELSTPLTAIPWRPVELDDIKCSIINVLLKHKEIDIINDKMFKKFIELKKINLPKFLKKLEDTKLVYIEENKLRFLIDEPLLVAKDGKVYFGENKNLEMSTYFNLETK